MKNTNTQTGSVHLGLIAIAILLFVSFAGYLVYSRGSINKSSTLTKGYLTADQSISADANTPQQKCRKNRTLVNADALDFISGKYKSAAKRGHGLICVKEVGVRQKVNGANGDTIVAFYKCNRGSVFAYDKHNPDGTGWQGGHKWKFKSDYSYKAGDMYALPPPKNATYYCIGNQHIGYDIKTNSRGYSGSGNLAGLGHTYCFIPYPDYQTDCKGKEQKDDIWHRCEETIGHKRRTFNPECETRYWFSHKNWGDSPRGTKSN